MYYHLGETAEKADPQPEGMKSPEQAKGSTATAKPPAPTSSQINRMSAEVESLIGQEMMKHLQAKTNAAFAEVGKANQKSLITTTAIDTGISLALAAVPVVGWVASVVYSAVMAVVRGITGGQLNREAKVIIHNAEKEATVLQNVFDAKIKKEQAKAIREETPAAIKLAIATLVRASQQEQGQAGLGFWAAFAAYAAANPQAVRAMTAAQTQMAQAASAGAAQAAKVIKTNWQQALQAAQAGQQNFVRTWEENQRYLEEQWGLREKEDDDFFDKVGNEIDDAIHKIGAGIESAMHKVGNALEDGADYVSGHVVVTKAKEAARQALETARVQQMINWSQAKKQLNSPAFRANLRRAIAQKILSNDKIRNMMIKTIAYRRTAENLEKTTPSVAPAPAIQQPTTMPAIQTQEKKSTLMPKLVAGGGILAALWYFTQ